MMKIFLEVAVACVHVLSGMRHLTEMCRKPVEFVLRCTENVV